jgi:rRNA processing protein Gar1
MTNKKRIGWIDDVSGRISKRHCEADRSKKGRNQRSCGVNVCGLI